MRKRKNSNYAKFGIPISNAPDTIILKTRSEVMVKET